MGEQSKKIGDFGEDAVKKFFGFIGWSDLQNNLDIKCIKSEAHRQKSEKGRESHGLDFLYSYKTPLYDQTLQICCISSKFHAEAYPDSSTLKTKFKSSLRDLDSLLDCFTKSEQCQSIKKQTRTSRAQYAGILIWLHSNVSSDAKQEIISELENINIPSDIELNHPIYVIDNNQASFIYCSKSFVDTNYKGREISFFYQKTGNNSSDQNWNSSGSLLPVDLITSKIIIFKATDPLTNDDTVIIAVNENFTQENLKKIMGLAHNITSNLPSKIDICFPDLNNLSHSNIVSETKNLFSDTKFSKRVTVRNFNLNHINF